MLVKKTQDSHREIIPDLAKSIKDGINEHIKPDIFVEKIDGCYDNVIGFPLSRFYHTCKNILNIPM